MHATAAKSQQWQPQQAAHKIKPKLCMRTALKTARHSEEVESACTDEVVAASTSSQPSCASTLHTHCSDNGWAPLEPEPLRL